MRVLASVAVISLAACQSSSERRPLGEPHLEMYNVQDLVTCTTSFGKCMTPDVPEGCALFEKKAKEAVSDVPWDDTMGWSLVFQDGLLIVRADDAAQRSVRAFLDSERARKK
jgi:hypothetical protein